MSSYEIKMTKQIVLLHGWGASSTRLGQLERRLKEKGWEVWAPDLPGFGQTPPPPTVWSLGDYVEWVRQGVAERGWSSFSVLGHSFGGSIAIEWAALDPQGLEKLILIAASGIRKKRSLQKLLARWIAKTGKAVLALPGLNKLRKPMRQVLYHFIGEYDYYRAQGVMKETLKKVLTEDLTDRLDRIRVPVLLLWGANDTLVPVADGHLMHRLIHHSTLKVFSGLDHNFIYQPSKDVLGEVMRFLEIRN